MMKCNHDVKGYEWQRCPKCGETVRISLFRQIIRCVLMIAVLWDLADRFADWTIVVLKLSEQNPHNISHALLGGILVVPAFFSDCKDTPSI